MTTLQLDMGALAPSLAEQLEAQGLRVKESQDIRLFQKDADAITRCSIRGLISGSTAHTARKRLMKNITTQLEPLT